MSLDLHSITVRPRGVVFEDPASAELLRRIRQIAPSDVTVLVVGETGTGKEIVARHIHELSQRARRPFIAVNCGAFSESLVDSELFGHEKGAFTGAATAKDGWFEAAAGGTLFLDEIGDFPPPMQVKLLRVLQEREVVRLGSRRATPIDVRLIAATNVNLEEAVAAGRFREDLFFRLNVATLRLVPLRDRPADIVPLAEHFLRLHAERLGAEAVSISGEAIQRLLDHPWPGNVRELENVLHQAVLTCRGGRIEAGDLNFSDVFRNRTSTIPNAKMDLGSLERALVALFEQNTPDLHARVEEALMKSAYAFCHRNQLATARLLGLSRNVVRARLIEFGLLPGGTRRRPPSEDARG